MRFKNDGNWPVSHRCEHTEKVRQGRHDDIKPVHWIWVSALFLLIVVGGAIDDLLTFMGV